MMAFLVFIAQFGAVFFLVLSSKLLRDDKWKGAMLVSWFISITQYIFFYTVTQTDDHVMTFFAGGFGASLGCGVSHLFYTRFIFKKKEK